MQEIHMISQEPRQEDLRLPGVKAFFVAHPTVSAVGIWAVFFVFTVFVLLITRQFFDQNQSGLIGIGLQTLVLGIALTALGWWRKVGFNHPREWRALRLLWLPALVILVPPLVLGANAIDGNTLIILIVGYVLTGITEEGIFRGLIFRVLQPTGPRRAAVISAVLFGTMHLVNLLIRANPAIVLAQCVGAFCDGLGFAAVRYRTNTLWPLVVLHMAHDLLLKFTRLPAIPLDVVQVTILMIYGFYLLRNAKTAPTVV